MSGRDDYQGDMDQGDMGQVARDRGATGRDDGGRAGSGPGAPSVIDDATAERLLAGRVVGAELEPVVQALRSLRSLAARPAPPASPVLAALMTPDAPPAPVVAATRPDEGGPVVAPPARVNGKHRPTAGRTRRSGRTAGRLAVRLAAAGLVVGVLGLGGAGFAGTLPEPVQEGFDVVVESVTPYEAPPRPGGDQGQADPTAPPDDPASPGGEHPSDFGGEVSEDAQDGGVDGPDVSDEARDRETGRPDVGEPGPPEGAPVAPDPAWGPPDSPPSSGERPPMPDRQQPSPRPGPPDRSTD